MTHITALMLVLTAIDEHTISMEYSNTTHCQDKSRTETVHSASKQTFLTDVGEGYGGIGIMPDPGTMLAATVASCMTSMMSVICSNNDAVGTGIRVESALVQGKQGIAGLNFRITLPKRLSELKNKLEQGALHCPVKKALSADIIINIEWDCE